MARIIDRLGWALAGALALGLIAVVAAIAGAGPLDPDEPPGSTPGVRLPGTPISDPGVAGFPIAISAPGSYYLVENITGVSGEQGIRIDTGNVTLDLNGFALTGVAGSLDGIEVNGAFDDIMIRNGAVREWDGDGIDAGTASGTTLEDLVVSGNQNRGINSGPGTISRVVARDNGSAGFTLSGSSATNVVSRGNLGAGFFLLDTSLTDCAASGNVSSGIIAEHSTVTQCTIKAGDADPGIELMNAGSHVAGNTIQTLTANGIESLGAGRTSHRIQDNHIVVGTTTADAIVISGTDNFVAGNTMVGTDPLLSVAAGNTVGPVVYEADPIASENPWANFSFTPP